MKDFQEVEQKLKEARLPDQDESGVLFDTWQQIMNRRRRRRRRGFLNQVPVWVWAFGSVAVIVLCILFMVLLLKT